MTISPSINLFNSRTNKIPKSIIYTCPSTIRLDNLWHLSASVDSNKLMLARWRLGRPGGIVVSGACGAEWVNRIS